MLPVRKTYVHCTSCPKLHWTYNSNLEQLLCRRFSENLKKLDRDVLAVQLYNSDPGSWTRAVEANKYLIKFKFPLSIIRMDNFLRRSVQSGWSSWFWSSWFRSRWFWSSWFWSSWFGWVKRVDCRVDRFFFAEQEICDFSLRCFTFLVELAHPRLWAVLIWATRLGPQTGHRTPGNKDWVALIYQMYSQLDLWNEKQKYHD